MNVNENTTLMYLTSGTSGEPKMVAHGYLYALECLVVGAFWYDPDEGSTYLIVADTGWGKAVWGKFYGQWFAGATVFVCGHEKFSAEKVMCVMEEYRIISFYIPPATYHLMLQEDFS